MNGLIIGSLGIYLLMVGFNGNSSKLRQYLQTDAPGFFPWAVTIAVLAVASENENTAKIAKPFIGLAILTFILSNFDRLKSEYDKLRDMALGASFAPAPAADIAPSTDPANQIPGGIPAPLETDPVSQIPTSVPSLLVH